MARFRTLDPEMLNSPQLDGLSLVALLMIDRLILASDDEGRQYGDARSIWRATFPRDEAPAGVDRAAVQAALEELIAKRIVVRYESGGQVYLQIVGWADGDSWMYQYVSRPKPSRFPPPPRGFARAKQRGSGKPPADRSGGQEPPPTDPPPLDCPWTAPGLPTDCPGGSPGEVRADVTRRDETRRDADATRRDASARATAPAPADAGAVAARAAEGTTESRSVAAALELLGSKPRERREADDQQRADELVHRIGLEIPLHPQGEQRDALERTLQSRNGDHAEFLRRATPLLITVQAHRLAQEATP